MEIEYITISKSIWIILNIAVWFFTITSVMSSIRVYIKEKKLKNITREKEEFLEHIVSIDNDGNIFPNGIDAQTAMTILCRHFVGKDWYVSYPASINQVYSELVHTIITKYPTKNEFDLELYDEITKKKSGE